MKLQNNSIAFELPLSWVRSTKNSLKQNSFRLKSTKLDWVSLAEVPDTYHFQQVLNELQEKSVKGLIIRGCTEGIAKQLKNKQYAIIQVGQEAVLNLDKKLDSKKSLKELIKRGQRTGYCRQITLNPENKNKLSEFKRTSTHGRKPQLKHLFIDEFTENTKCFAWINRDGKWQAVMTISKVNKGKMQTELLLRKKGSPAGTMEALIYEVSHLLKRQGYSFWSLGEVPFITDEKAKRALKSYCLSWIGDRLSFAYDAKSLYSFKNKFSPEWQPVYLCGYPKISWLSLMELSIRSNFFRLVLSQFSERLIQKIFADGRIN